MIMENTIAVPNAIVLEILNQHNYKQWRFTVKTYLLSKDLWKVVIAEPPKREAAEFEIWTKKNAEALHAILISCGADIFSIIDSDTETAKRAWDALEAEFNPKTGFVLEDQEGHVQNNGNEFDRYIHFIDYVINGDLDNVKKCLRELDDPYNAVTARDPRNKKGKTVLHIAAKKGYVQIVKEVAPLLKQEDLEVKSTKGYSALHLGVLARKADMVKELMRLMRPEGLEVQNSDGYTALHLAIKMNSMHIAEELMRLMRPEGLEVQNSDGYTALHLAIKMNSMHIAEELIPRVRQEVQTSEGYTALHLAIILGNMRIAKVLMPLMRQEVLEIKDRKGCTVLHVAINVGNMDIAKELIQLVRGEALEIKDINDYTPLGRALAVAKEADAKEMARSMVNKNKSILCIGNSPSNTIPVVYAFASHKWELCHYLYSLTPLEVLKGPNGAELICSCFDGQMKGSEIAWDLLQRFPSLAIATDQLGRSPMLQLVGNSRAFLTGTPLTLWQKLIYNRIHIQPDIIQPDIIICVSIDVADFEDNQGVYNQWRLMISSVRKFLRGLANGLYKYLGMKRVSEIKLIHKHVLQILWLMSMVIRAENLTQVQLNIVHAAIFEAVEQGRVEFIRSLCRTKPSLLRSVNRKNRDIFDYAIECRQQDIFSLIYGLESRDRFWSATRVDKFNNNKLHLAGSFSLRPRFNQIHGGAPLQMQRELQWFKGVERFVAPQYHESSNYSDGMTPRELFTKNHKKLMADAEASMKGTATSCTVVGALIVTIMFTVAFTVPGGNNDATGFPVFLDKKLFKTFIVADTISLVSSTTSVIMFLGILTSRYSEDDFLKSLPKKMMIGLFTLFLSIATMMIAFSTAIIIMFGGMPWIVLSVLLGIVPVSAFVRMQFPLLLQTYIFTYGPEIFDKNVKCWY